MAALDHPRFELGKLVAMPAALTALEEAGQEPAFSFRSMSEEIGVSVALRTAWRMIRRWGTLAHLLRVPHTEGCEVVGYHRGGE
jgi:hypothetical protein